MLHDFGPVHDAVNHILQTFFPGYAQTLANFKTALCSNDVLVRQAFINLRSLFTSMTVHSQRLTSEHRDEGNPVRGVEGLVVMGDFSSGGNFLLKGLNLKLAALPGSLILFRAHPFVHAITDDWEPGRWRLSVAHYIKAAALDGHLGESYPPLPGMPTLDFDELERLPRGVANELLSASLKCDYRGPVPNGTKFISPYIPLDTYHPPVHMNR